MTLSPPEQGEQKPLGGHAHAEFGMPGATARSAQFPSRYASAACVSVGDRERAGMPSAAAVDTSAGWKWKRATAHVHDGLRSLSLTTSIAVAEAPGAPVDGPPAQSRDSRRGGKSRSSSPRSCITVSPSRTCPARDTEADQTSEESSPSISTVLCAPCRAGAAARRPSP